MLSARVGWNSAPLQNATSNFSLSDCNECTSERSQCTAHPKYIWKRKKWEAGRQTSRDVSDSSFPNKNRAGSAPRTGISRYLWREKAAAIQSSDSTGSPVTLFARPLTSQISRTLDPLGDRYCTLAQRQNNNSSGGTSSAHKNTVSQSNNFIGSRNVYRRFRRGGKSICVIVSARRNALGRCMEETREKT